jgi:hypothetical protein
MGAKRFWAMSIKRTLLGIAVLFGFGVLFDYLTNDPFSRSPFMAGLVTIGVYLIASIAFGLLGLITSLLYLWLFAGSDMVNGMVEEMHAAKLPPPRRTDPKIFSYLLDIASDEDVPAADRVKAASFYSAYNTLMGQGIFRALAIGAALDKAVMRYSHEAPSAS